MAAKDAIEPRVTCPNCGEKTRHNRQVQIISEGQSELSRQPYAIDECLVCGKTHRGRL